MLKKAATAAIAESRTSGRITDAEAAAVLEEVRGGVDKAFGTRHEGAALDRQAVAEWVDTRQAKRAAALRVAQSENVQRTGMSSSRAGTSCVATRTCSSGASQVFAHASSPHLRRRSHLRPLGLARLDAPARRAATPRLRAPVRVDCSRPYRRAAVHRGVAVLLAAHTQPAPRRRPCGDRAAVKTNARRSLRRAAR